MNSFVKSGSKLFLLITCLFIFTLFIDQANILDVVFGNNNDIDIQHPEEVEKCENQASAFLNKTDYSKNQISNNSKIQHTHKILTISKRIITDEDSPSTETINIQTIVAEQSFQIDEKDNYTFTSISKAIYLLNSAILI